MKVVRLFALIVALTLVAAACGGDSVEEALVEEAQSQATGGTDAGAAGDDEGADDEGTDGGSTDDTIGTLPDTPVGDIPGLSSECEALANLVFGFTQLVIGGDADQLLAAAQSGLPSSLDDEIAIIMEGANQYADALGDLEIDLSDPTSFAALSPEEIAQLEAASQVIDTDAFNSALEAVSEYGEAECADSVPGG